jgi:hypothetical protein
VQAAAPGYLPLLSFRSGWKKLLETFDHISAKVFVSHRNVLIRIAVASHS